ncbi:MAG TPA: M12 family metallo-peptidase [Thermoanaerobaculia bacterium]|nr:M12 family metallo-peptidase [Thermoanaerobaculia bacterium]
MHQTAQRLLISCLLVFTASVVSAARIPELPRIHGDDLARDGRNVRVGDHLRVTDIEVPATSETLAFDVERFEVFAPDAEIVVHGAHGATRMKPPANTYFRGAVAGEDGSRVFLEVHPDGVTRGIVTRAGDDSYLIDSAQEDAPPPGSPRRLRAERADAALLKARRTEPFKCADDELPPVPHDAFGFDALGGPPTAKATSAASASAPASAPARTAHVAIETDFEYYSKFNNTTNATNYVGNLIGYASTIYVNELNTSLVVQSLSLWTTASDPWVQSTTACGPMEFGHYWNKNHSGVSRTIAHFLSGKGLGGGIAWLGVLCSGGFGASGSCPGLATDAPWGGGYGFTASISGRFDINNPTVMWDIMAVAHEIGHNFNSPHTHCYAGISGNPSPIDQCYGGEGGCYSGATSLPGPAGAGSGTIMSYCHLTRGSYSDMSLNFGTNHPYGVAPGREAARMNTYVTSVASGNPACLAPVSSAFFSNGFESGSLPAPWADVVP